MGKGGGEVEQSEGASGYVPCFIFKKTKELFTVAVPAQKHSSTSLGIVNRLRIGTSRTRLSLFGHKNEPVLDPMYTRIYTKLTLNVSQRFTVHSRHRSPLDQKKKNLLRGLLNSVCLDKTVKNTQDMSVNTTPIAHQGVK